ncbi:MAG: TonB-dependent receptor [Phaeodactylibacter sp.]|nr:TonB-dependent receptor [Phaeodactylibacter sp.]MCB9302051.1 TonB-dependent receptor [Lewinellaceae bacterium]HQU57588.1 TonB-dependent receptor [Saprospiraceae bacterium]
MSTRICILFFLFLGFGSCLSAHNIIRGKVLDATTQLPLEGASIQVEGLSYGVATNRLGQFTLYTDTSITAILVSYIGYETQRIEIRSPEEVLSIGLEPAAIDMDQVVVSGADTKSLNTLSKVDVGLRAVNSSQDVLRLVPGLFTAQHAGGGKAEQMFLRGFDIDHGTDINVSVDGIPVNMVSHAHGQGYADLHFLIPELIQAVDFGKGPYYTTQGNFTTAGYVQFHTFNALEHNLVKMEVGQFNTLRTLAMVDVLGTQAQARGQNAYMAAEYLITDGPFDSPQHFNRMNLFGKYTNMLDDGSLFTLEASAFQSKWDASGQIPERAVEQGLIGRFGAIDDAEGGQTSRKNLSAHLVKNLNERTYVENQFYYSQYDFELYSNFTLFLNDPINGDQIRQKESRNLFGYQGAYHLSSELANNPLASTIGIGFRYDDVNGNELTHTRNRRENLMPIALGNIDELNAFAFIDESLRLGRLSINAGARLDFLKFDYVDQLNPEYQTLSQQKTALSPKLNFLYELTSNWQLYFKSGMGFHSNDTRVVVAQKGAEILPAAYGADLGTLWKPAPRLVLNTALWYLFLEQEFVYVGDEGIVEPSGRTRRMGADLSIRYQLTDWLFADADVNYTYARSADDPEGENFIPLAPDLTSTGGLTFQHPSGLNGSLRYRHLDSRPANEDGSVMARGYTVVDAVLNYTHRRFEVGLTLENVLNTDWNEAQFDTESRLFGEVEPVSELHFTPGMPRYLRARVGYFF